MSAFITMRRTPDTLTHSRPTFKWRKICLKKGFTFRIYANETGPETANKLQFKSISLSVPLCPRLAPTHRLMAHVECISESELRRIFDPGTHIRENRFETLLNNSIPS